MIRRANAVLSVLTGLGSEKDPRLDGYLEQIGEEYSKTYQKALEIATNEGHTDIIQRLKKYGK